MIKKIFVAATLFVLLPTVSSASGSLGQIGSETVSLEVSDAQDLAAGGWEQKTEQVWRKKFENGASGEVAFGLAAHDRAAKWLDREIEILQGLENPDAEQELELFEAVVRRDQLSKWMEERDSADKLVDTSSGSVCWGSAIFTHTYGFQGFVTPTVISDSLYTEFGPLSSGTKTTYARARVCGDGVFCNEDTDTDSAGSSFAVRSTATAAISPFFGCTAKAYGYVLVVDSSGCTDIVSFSSGHFCTAFFNDQI